ncbi:MAG: MFS transporter [Desulfatiglandaceae bacterium]
MSSTKHRGKKARSPSHILLLKYITISCREELKIAVSIQNQKPHFFYGWIVVAAGFLLSFFGIGARYSFGVFLRSIQTEFGITRASASGIFSIYMLLCVLFALLGGWALDKYGPRKIGIVMGTFTGLSLLLTSRVSAPWQLLITYSFLLSLGTGAMYGVVNTTTSRWFIKKRGFVVGITSSGGGVGAIVLAPFATYLISGYNWRIAFIVIGIISWILMVFASFWLIKDPRETDLLPDGARMDATKGIGTKGLPKKETSDFITTQALKTRQFWFLVVSWLFLSLSLNMIIIHVVPYALDAGISSMDAAYILSILGIANIFGRLILGRLSDAMGRKALGVICGLFHSASLLWLMYSHQLWMIYAFAFLFGILWGGSGTIITSLVGDIFGTRNLGAIMGIITSVWAFGAAVGPALGGFIFDATGSYFGAFGAGAGALLISACSIACLRPISKTS